MVKNAPKEPIAILPNVWPKTGNKGKAGVETEASVGKLLIGFNLCTDTHPLFCPIPGKETPMIIGMPLLTTP